jgi:hypothetical protein
MGPRPKAGRAPVHPPATRAHDSCGGAVQMRGRQRLPAPWEAGLVHNQTVAAGIGTGGCIAKRVRGLIGRGRRSRSACHGISHYLSKNRQPVDPCQQQIAQFIGLCSKSKWSGHLTKSPFLALLATAGSNTADKIISACSHAVRRRKLRRNCKNPDTPAAVSVGAVLCGSFWPPEHGIAGESTRSEGSLEY